MTSERTPEPDPRKKRALVIGGIIAVAAIGWNIEEWSGNDSPVVISIDGDRANVHEARDVIRSAIRGETRDVIRGDEESGDEETGNDEADGEATDEAVDDETVVEDADTGERRLVETDSDDNQRSFRIEGDDGRGVTISVDTGTE